MSEIINIIIEEGDNTTAIQITDSTGVNILNRSLNINGNDYNLSADREWRVAQADTGVINLGSGLSYKSDTTIDIDAIRVLIVDNASNPNEPSFVKVNYEGELDVVVPTLGTGQSTYVLLGTDGIFFQNTFPTSAERKERVWIGKVGHPNGIITVVANEPDFIQSPLAQFRDLFQAFNYINNGVYASANGVNLNVNINSGTIIGNGINRENSVLAPNDLFIQAESPMNFLYRTQTGGTGTLTTIIDPNSIDVAGTITPILSGASIQYIFLVPNGGYIIQYGQNTYNTLLEAIQYIGKEQFVLFPNLERNAILISVFVVEYGATDLSDTTQAQFFKADKIGQIIGSAGGVSTTTLQGAYNNSVSPQITTTAPLGALTIKGTIGDNNNILNILNSADTSTLHITEIGDITARNLIKEGSNKNEFLMGDGSTTSVFISGKTITDTNYTLINSDHSLQLQVTTATPTIINVPTGLTVGFAVDIIQEGLGQITFSGASGVTLRFVPTVLPTSQGQYSSIGIQSITNLSNTYKLVGELTEL